MECRTCELLKLTRNKVFQDEAVTALLVERPAAVGHIMVVPNNHHAILESAPDDIVSRMFIVANKLSTVCFDSLSAAGTNLMVMNGVAAGQEEPHASVHVVPRREGDNLNLQWQPRQLSEDEFSTIELQVAEGLKGPAKVEKPVDLDVKPETVEDNYLLRSLRRIP